MILISAYNSPHMVSILLNSIAKTRDLDEDVWVVGTDPSQHHMVEWLQQLNNTIHYPFQIWSSVTPYAGYDSGAQIWMFQHYPAEYYIFLQDSITIKDPDWLNKFKERRGQGVTAWIKFKMPRWDSKEQYNWVVDHFEGEELKHPEYGIFGPMYQISHEDIMTMHRKYDLNRFIPPSKMTGQSGMERGWSYLCSHCGIQMDSLESEKPWDFTQKKLFNKQFAGRQ